MDNYKKIDKNNIEDILPLAPIQEGMLFHYLNNPDSNMYFEQISINLQGIINHDLFHESWKIIVKANGMLRTVFRWDKLERPIQIILNDLEIPIREFDFSSMQSHRQEDMLKTTRDNDRKEKIDLAISPFRITLCKLSEDKYEMIISNHHIIFDGWSTGILLKEFLQVYTGLTEGNRKNIVKNSSYKDYIKVIQKLDKSKNKYFWEQYLKNFENSTILPVDKNKKNKDFETDNYESIVSMKLMKKLDSFTKTNHISLATVIYTVWGILLQKYNNSEDIIFGTTVTDRSYEISGIEDIIGLFINTIPLRLTAEKNDTLLDLLKKIEKGLIDREEYKSTSLTDIKLYSNMKSDDNLFDSIVVVENYPIDSILSKDDNKIKGTGKSSFAKTNYDLTLVIMNYDNLVINLIYNKEIFDRETIERLSRHFVIILEELVVNPQKKYPDVDILTENEKTQFIEILNNTVTSYPKDKTICQLFEEEVKRHPDKIALVLNENRMTYNELNEKANVIARVLRDAGVKPDFIVALLMDRSFEMIACIMGILKAGGAYLPLDPDYPEFKLASIIQDAKASILITNKQLIEDKFSKLNEFENLFTKIIYPDKLDVTNTGDVKNNLEIINKPDDLAYVMYTSGSTGNPKGILTSHYNITRVVKKTNYIDICDSDVILQLSNYAFDGSTFDIFGSLLNGAGLVLVNKTNFLEAGKLTELIIKENVSVFFTTTALFNTLVDIDVSSLKNVRKLLFGGERVSFNHVKKAFNAMGKNKLIHVYGPTETTVFATFYPIDELNENLETIPIGKPIANTEIYILDNFLNLVPIGAPGELYIGGDGLSRGYLNNPESQAEKYIQNPFKKNGLLYKSGDLVKYLPDGNVVFLDRLDKQVKLRGFRIELGEIESQLMKYQVIKKAVVSVKNDKSNNKFLCAYIAVDKQIDALSIKEFLSQNLPDYMIPAQIVILHDLPLTSNGKIDIKVLNKYSEDYEFNKEFEGPSNYLEEKLQTIWIDILGINQISINDNFFDIGGHSLKATVLSSKIHRELDISIPLHEIFNNPTIKKLAKFLINFDRTVFQKINPSEKKDYYDLSSSQMSLYVQEQFEGINTSYNIPLSFSIEGKLQRDNLKKALNLLIDRYEVLRTSFHMIDGNIVQKINDTVDYELDFQESEEKNIEQLFIDFVKPFDLKKSPLFRTKLIKIKDDRHFLFIDMHHIISDGISLIILINDLFNLYSGKELLKPELHYKDFAYWQNSLLNNNYYEKQEKFWREKLSGEIPVLNFKSDIKRGEKRSFKGNCIKFTIPSDLGIKLINIVKKNNITLNTLLLSTYSLLLNKYSSDEDIIIGSLVSGRNHADIENVIGMFNNFLPLRIKFDDNMILSDFFKSNNSNILEYYENQDLPLSKIIEKINFKTDLTRNPLFDTMMIFHNEFDSVNNIEIGELKISNYEFNHYSSKLDFKLDIYSGKTQAELNCILEYNTDLFKQETMERFGNHYLNILNQIIKNQDVKLGDIGMISEEERKKILFDFNNTKAEYPKDKTLCELFEKQATMNPDNTAIIYEGKKVSYAELNKKSNQLARLLRKKGIKKDVIAAIMLERSELMGVGLQSIIKAGGAYLPISPDYPDERINFMLADSKAEVLLTVAQYKDRIKFDKEIIYIDDDDIYKGDDGKLEKINDVKDLSYIIYTSGSTGNPKGVMIENHSIVNRLNWMQKNYPLGSNDVILQKTPYTFDVSVWELFWWSITGAKVCFLKPGGEKDPAVIVDAIESNGVTTMHFVPSMLNAFLDYLENNKTDLSRLKSLKQVFASGEALSAAHVIKFNGILNSANKTRLINLYGPTEATVDVSYYNCPEGNKLSVIPIGKPIDNIRLYVLNGSRKLQPVGIPGELYISGVGLARGYLNREELTAEKFVEDPFNSGEKMYKTGDLSRWLADGNIEYLGRMDNQVKVRGFRIELGEIENGLIRHEKIKEAAATVREDKTGNKYICAYIVSEVEMPVQEIREYLGKQMPEYMIPSYFIRLDRLPLTSNGKVDRKSLPEPDGQINTGTEYAAPTNEIEEQLVRIWKEVLGVDKVGINDSFFDLGGHSLKATGVIAKIEKDFGVSVRLGELFTKPTIKEIAIIINSSDKNKYSEIKHLELEEYFPVSSSQNRLYIINRLEGNNTTYNLPSAVMIEGEIYKEKFEVIFRQLIKRHETLRTSFDLISGKTVQKIHDSVDFNLGYIDSNENEIKDIIEKFIKPFDMLKAPMLRALLIKISDKKNLLLFDLHHIIADGISSIILVKEFIQLYEGKVLPDLNIQYKDFAVWQNELFTTDKVKKQEEYWLDLFKGEIPVLNLPCDFQRPNHQLSEGNKISLTLSGEIVETLKKVVKNTGSTLYMVLLAVYNILLFKYSNQDDIVVGSPTAGRQNADVENLIGMFVNTLAIRNFPNGDKSFNLFLQELKDNVLKAFENQDYQFEKLVEKLDIQRNLSRNPLFDTMFVLQNMGIPQIETNDLKFLPYNIENKVSKFDITFEVVEEKHDLKINIEYSTKLFKQETMERFGNHYLNILNQIIKNQDVKLGDIGMISEEERKKILFDFNNTKAEYPKDKTLCELFEKQATMNPDNTAIIYEGKKVSYAELNKKSNQLARLLRKKGIKKDVIAAIMLERSELMGVGLQSIIKAGGAYLPISPDYPDERINFMLADSKAEVLLTVAQYKDRIKFDKEIIYIDDDDIYKGDDGKLEKINDVKDLSYIIYTSGSTGNPKGVMIENHSIVNRLNWMQKNYPLGSNDVILQKTPYTFDVSVWELFWWSITGAKVCFLKPGGEKDPAVIVDAIESNGVTTMHFVPSMLNAFLDYLENNKTDLSRLKSLKQVFASGEALSAAHVIKFNGILNSANKTRLINLYGPTEATVDVSYYNCPEGNKLSVIPIGKPIDNIRLYVLNGSRKLQPVGIPGELYISGVGLARGYLNREELTAEKFVEDPFNSGEKMYKTGDLSRWLADGNIEYLGRMDNQVKVRGFRIELGEIENGLIRHEKIKEAAATVREDKTGNKYICAYIVSEVEMPVQEIREYLGKQMPEYMIPSYFIRLDRLPLTSNGKVDRKSLPEPDGQINTGTEYAAPTNEIEEQLVRIWKEVLGVDKVGINEKFFDLGGYSILLIQMHTKIELLFPNKITITDYFSYPTIASLAKFIMEKGESKQLSITPVSLPEDYFLSGQAVSYDNMFKFNLNNDLYKKIIGFNDKSNINIFDFLSAVYLYLFAEISGKTSIEIQQSYKEKDLISPLTINLSEVNEISQLFKMVGEKNNSFDLSYNLQQISNVNFIKNQFSIVPIISKKGFLSNNVDLFNFYDLVFEVYNDDEKIEIMCSYNGKVLKKDKVKEFINLYIRLTEILIDKNKL